MPISIIYYYLATYGGPSTLPSVLSGKCDSTSCSTLTSDLATVKSCLTDPTASACSGNVFVIYHDNLFIHIPQKI